MTDKQVADQLFFSGDTVVQAFGIFYISHSCKTSNQYSDYVDKWHHYNSSISRFFTLYVPVETGINTLQGSYKIYNFTITVSPTLPGKAKIEPHILKSVIRVSILLLNSKQESESYHLKCLFTSCVQNVRLLHRHML